MPKFSVRGVWQRWRESYPLEGGKSDRPITVFTGVRSLGLNCVGGAHFTHSCIHLDFFVD